jgi:hypothetical protein
MAAFALPKYVLGIIRIPHRVEHLSHTCDPQFRQLKGRDFVSSLNGTEQQTQRVSLVIILGGEYTFANLRASRSVAKGKLTQRRFSSVLVLSKGRAKVAIHFDVATL